MKNAQVAAIIPARGGSKGVSRKNIRLLAGKPLIAWTIEAAQACPEIGRVIVSTEDDEIARIAQEYGAEIPFRRPAELAGDTTTDLPVCRHALEWLAENEGYKPEIIVWLRPTAPLRSSQDITGAIARLRESGADCVRSVSEATHHPYWMKWLENDRLVSLIPGKDETMYPRRQMLPPAYFLNGVVDAIWTRQIAPDGVLFQGQIAGYVIPAERSVDLESEIDFDLAEVLIRKKTK